MRVCITVFWLAVFPSTLLFGADRRFVTSERLTLGVDANRSASVRVADVNRDGKLDVIVANGRHWPQQNYVFLNQGRALFTVKRKLGADLCTSYAAESADLDGDGDTDIAVGNDMAPNEILLNTNGRFQTDSQFGRVSSVRSLTLTDIDRDGDIDVLTTCRGRENQISLNDGKGQFASFGTFGTKQDSTIDVAVTDWNGDGHSDLVLANRDNQSNSILLNDGQLRFEKSIPFGSRKDQTRAVVVADVNGDSHSDIVTANIGQPNRVYLSDGSGKFLPTITFGRDDGRSYSLAVADMDNDQDMDLIVGNVGQQNAVFFNTGDGTAFTEVRFGDTTNATYALDTGDFDGDGYADIVVANSDAKNFVFLNRTASPDSTQTSGSATSRAHVAQAEIPSQTTVDKRSFNGNWPSFRGSGAKGYVEDFPVRMRWNADAEMGEAEGVLWSIPVPGLAHSSPMIRGDRIFLTTAISTDNNAPLKIGRGGQPEAADDDGEQSWVVLCYDRGTGKLLWRQTARRGRPQATRHAKATHANTSVAIDDKHVVAFFGSEGLYCYDLDGILKWSRDLGVVNISKYGIGWGYASSPAIHNDRIAIVCDDPQNPFVATLKLSDGEEIWRSSRKGICDRSWGTPFIHSTPSRTQVVVNGWPWIVSYDLNTGDELWRIRGGGDNPVPTPFEANGWFYITNAHGAESPIFVVRPDANGDITPPKEAGTNKSIVWSTRRGGSYMSTPVVYGDYLYLGNTNGVLRCYHARTGKKIYEKRLGSEASLYSSLVAADGKVFCASENGVVFVVKAGPNFEVLAKNSMGQPLFATPAIARGILYFRTTQRLIAIEPGLPNE